MALCQLIAAPLIPPRPDGVSDFFTVGSAPLSRARWWDKVRGWMERFIAPNIFFLLSLSPSSISVKYFETYLGDKIKT